MNIFSIFTKAFKFAKLIPLIILLMSQAEIAIPGELSQDGTDTRTKGERKLAMVKGFLAEFWGGAEDSFGDFKSAEPFIERIIARFAGLFGKGESK